MKINVGKLLAVLGHMVVAAPAVAAAMKPVIDAAKGNTNRTTGK